MVCEAGAPGDLPAPGFIERAARVSVCCRNGWAFLADAIQLRMPRPGRAGRNAVGKGGNRPQPGFGSGCAVQALSAPGLSGRSGAAWLIRRVTLAANRVAPVSVFRALEAVVE